MATADHSDDTRFSLLEMDAPRAALASAPRAAPAPSQAPALAPTVLEASRALLTGATTEAALDGAVAQIVAQYPAKDHPVRVALRPVYRERLAAIVALRWTAFLAMWRDVGADRAYVARGTSPEVTPTMPHRGEFRRHGGEWRGWIAHTGRAVRPGDRVVMVRRDGSETREYVRAVLNGQHNGGCLIEFGAAPEAAPVVQPAPQPAPVVEAAPVVASTGSLVEALGGIASEGAVNAATQASGSLAGGTMAGVGFTSAAGYVQALANGVKRATADGYLATLRSRYSYTDEQIAGLQVTIIPEASDLPVGPGIVHTPTGPDIFTQRRIAAESAAAALRRTADATTAALAQRFVTADESSTTAWWAIGWRGVGSITRGELIAACGEAPRAKVQSTQLARVMDSLRGQNFDCARVEAALPAGVRVRWQIGRGKEHAAYVGGEYGRVLAIVDLANDGSLTFDGDTGICADVRGEFARLIDEEVLRPGDVTTWLQQILRDRYGAVADGHDYLVAPLRREAARAFFTQVAKVWGVAWKRGGIQNGLPMLGRLEDNVANILGGILQGLIEEVEAQEHLWLATVEAADKRAEKVGARAAATALKRLDGDGEGDQGLSARINGFTVLGEGPLAPLRARVASLRSLVVAAVEAADGSMRTAMLELR